MASWFDRCLRCSNCGISYPASNPKTCQVEACKGPLDPVQDKPDADWKEKVAYMNAPEAEPTMTDDKVYGWRMKQLVYAGAPVRVAEEIAADRTIDLHKAVDVFQKAGPKLAEAILL